MDIYKKQTFLMESGPSHNPEKMHLHIVCFDPDIEGNTVIVGVDTYKNDLCNSDCILYPYEHQFITSKSFVQYRWARIEKATTLQKAINMQKIIIKEDMNNNTFYKIRNRLVDSDNVSKIIKRYSKSRMPNNG